jgi:DNA repair protein RadC
MAKKNYSEIEHLIIDVVNITQKDIFVTLYLNDKSHNLEREYLEGMLYDFGDVIKLCAMKDRLWVEIYDIDEHFIAKLECLSTLFKHTLLKDKNVYLESNITCRKFLERLYLNENKELFTCIYLNENLKVIDVDQETIKENAQCNISPVFIISRCKALKASGVIFAQNNAQKTVIEREHVFISTMYYKHNLEYFDIYVIDHFIINSNIYSFIEKNYIG